MPRLQIYKRTPPPYPDGTACHDFFV